MHDAQALLLQSLQLGFDKEILCEIFLLCSEAFFEVIGRGSLVPAEQLFHPGVEPCFADVHIRDVSMRHLLT